jgi:hypothetical protein
LQDLKFAGFAWKPFLSTFVTPKADFGCFFEGDVAQLVEQRTENPCVGGSIPSVTTLVPHMRDFLFPVTQLQGFRKRGIMEMHQALSDAEFELQFKTCTLDPTLFTHEAHLRLAWIHIKQYGIERAIEDVNAQLLSFVAHLGATDKFNKTVTIAALHAVNHFMKRSAADNFQGFIQEFPRLKTDFKALMGAHYAFDIFKSDKAKAKYLPPDLLPFDGN